MELRILEAVDMASGGSMFNFGLMTGITQEVKKCLSRANEET